MGEVSLETAAYAKIILHAAKYPHCAVNGVLLADGTKIRDGAKNQDLDIVDTIPLFHHSHYLSPMAEIALTQVLKLHPFHAITITWLLSVLQVDNKRMLQHLDTPAIKLHKLSDGKWKLKDANKVMFQTPYVLETVSHLLQRGVQKDLVDFDNYLDDLSQDWTNLGIEKLIASINASNTIDCKEDEKLFR
ncbi:hypothetical protein HF086_005074 [Spodoptera exigua]|uniref:Uncharacterized protein n=1 Tax=Spodoptera exigua TaxID=7107 RepID=A0A922SGB3_SPOEX|nr:hypothetical protein HF086_005074 [Spodoptera exigua]